MSQNRPTLVMLHTEFIHLSKTSDINLGHLETLFATQQFKLGMAMAGEYLQFHPAAFHRRKTPSGLQ